MLNLEDVTEETFLRDVYNLLKKAGYDCRHKPNPKVLTFHLINILARQEKLDVLCNLAQDTWNHLTKTGYALPDAIKQELKDE